MGLTEETYCRQLEAYLCRKNDGHLVRIVGPAFEQVCGWAERGVPLTIAQQGIDRYFERYYAKGPRRRPVRIEFCEADVLDVFDEWRRAVGVPDAPASPVPADAAAESGVGADGTHNRRSGSLPSHLERVIARLTALRAGENRSLDAVLDGIVRELDAARATARGLRGPARDALLDRLGVLDRTLLNAAREAAGASQREQLAAVAEAELASFRSRMTPDAFRRALAVSIDRGLRERLRLPTLTFE